MNIHPGKILIFLLVAVFMACNSAEKSDLNDPIETSRADSLVSKYTPVRLDADLNTLTAQERQMIPILIEAARLMDQMFWYEAYGDPSDLMAEATSPAMKQYININYGPWDRLEGNKPFLPGVDSKPAGANFYPPEMTREEFEEADLNGKSSLYTFIRRDMSGALKTVPYHEQFASEVKRASDLLKEAGALAEDEGLRRYLELRADALLTDDYQASDRAWLDMKDNTIDVVIGPIETYEDQLYGYKAAHEAYILIKDKEWSARLSRYADLLPYLQENLPVDARYKQEKPGTDTELNAYDVIYYAGDCNAGSKTIAINLPNDEEVQLEKGTRRLQLKNAMRAKFEKILQPIADELIDPSQRSHITFDAFFANTMFHEVAHGLGIKNTIDGQGTVRKALKEHASAIEEGKADILGLYMINQLHARGEIEGDLKDYYVTFLASIFRSVRFGAASAHGKANMIRFNYFKEKEAFVKSDDGTYRVDFDRFQEATNELSALILSLQGDGDYEKVGQLIAEMGVIGTELQQDLERLSARSIPVDIVFEQGPDVLGI